MQHEKNTENVIPIMENELMAKIVSLAKRRGFIFPGSEIYGGLRGTWDYGPMGALLKKNFKDEWWREMVQFRDDMVGIDAAIMMNPRAWEASGHVAAFTDPLVECKLCHQRFRADKPDELRSHEESHNHEKVQWTDPQKFNLLVRAYLGVVEGKESEIYLRGEITNGVHVNFKNILDSTRVRVPFGVAQIGKAFRNEITPGNFIFRTREFEQMETQFYIKPDEEEGMKWFEYWKQNRMEWLRAIGFKEGSLRFRDHEPSERAHYARAATDIEFNAPWGWDEMMGIHHRGDWDLRRHQEYSGVDMSYKDPETGESYIPWDIETSSGVDRPLLFLLLDAYAEEGNRVILKLHPRLAPYKAAVFPLLANKPELVAYARKVYDDLRARFFIAWDDRGNIGKRYYAQDEIGTPYCITVDFETLENDTVTVRDRDTAEQERVNVKELEKFLSDHIGRM